jgi:hypothetical protein
MKRENKKEIVILSIDMFNISERRSEKNGK